jgi:hypothetical protein
MTLDDLDAELTHARAQSALLKTRVVAELETELESTTDPSFRRFLLGELATVKAISVRPKTDPDAPNHLSDI